MSPSEQVPLNPWQRLRGTGQEVTGVLKSVSPNLVLQNNFQKHINYDVYDPFVFFLFNCYQS